ncbi:MAG TPA: OsmC family protein [Gemmatimonadales bacterium]|jgi:lipoyl-dependent peroxiredoxin|nr:OsmC family protein [Gemmatimonadales bacterium]
MERKATARWTGDLRSGTGTVRLGSGVLETPYTFKARFEDAPGTNPEELLGAAHAACFTMALSAQLARGGHIPRRVDTEAVVHLDKVGESSVITRIELITRGDVPGVSEAEFKRLAEETKVGCIISKALAAVPMTVQATLAAG